MKKYYIFLAISTVFFLVICGIFLKKEYFSTDDPALVVGQNFAIGIRGPRLDKYNLEMLETVKPGAIVLYKYNIKSNEDAKILIDELQKVAIRTTGVPYLIMVDEEPGGATRFGFFTDYFTEGPTFHDMATIERDAQRLRDIGVNVVLSPLADTFTSKDAGISHRLAFMDAAEQMKFNQEFIKIMSKNGIATTLKHFPGIGSLKGNTHADIFHLSLSTSTLAMNYNMFQSGIDSGADFVMTTHAIFDNINPNRAASLDPETIEILRDKLNFKGFVISDDIINMPVGNPAKITVNDATLAILMAGHNFALMGSKIASTTDAYNFVLGRYKADRSIRSQIYGSYSKILEYKKTHLQ